MDSVKLWANQKRIQVFLKITLKKPFTIQQWFILLVIACILPATIATAFFIHRSFQREYANVGRTTIDTARALMQAVDRELSSSEGTLLALATSPYLTSGNLAAFHEQAQEALRHRKGNNFVLSDVTGQQLINTFQPFGMPLPHHGNPDQLRRVFDTAESSISDLYIGGVTGRPIISVDVPVLRGNRVIYDLSLGFSPERLGEILKRQHLPADWVVGIFDSEGVLVARTRDPERFVGHKGSAALIKRMAEVSEDSLETVTRDGVLVISAFSRSAVSNWAVGIGVPRATLTKELWKSISFVIAGTLLLLAAGFVLAKIIGNKITRSIRALVTPAMALGHGEPVVIPHLSFREAEDVGQALVKASALLQKRTGERDRAEKAEQEIRLIKQQLEQSEALQRSIFEGAPDAVLLVASSGLIVHANRGAESVFGYIRDQLIGLAVEDLLPIAARQHHLGLRDSFFAQPLRRPMGGGLPLLGRRADGSEFPVDVMLSPIRALDGDMVIATVRDVTERRRNEEELNALNKRLALATQAGEIAVWEWDLAGDTLWWDERMYALYKVRQTGAVVKYAIWREYVHQDDIARVENEVAEALADTKAFATEFRIVWPDGQIRIIRADAVVSKNSAGKPLRMTGINWDVSSSKQKEAAINAALLEKETLLKELYHRVKNNLQVITSLFNLQARTLPEGAARIALNEGANRVRAMALVHEKLYQSGNLSSINLKDYISDLCRQLGNTAGAGQQGILLDAEVEPIQVGLETAVPLGLLLNELISNSLKHAFPEGRRGRIVVRLESCANGTTLLTVFDNGVGFPAGLDAAAFNTLGLRLVGALTAQLDGKFSWESRDGAYASLTFQLGNPTDVESRPQRKIRN